MAEPGSLNLGIPFSKHLWAAQAKVCGAIVKTTQRKRLTRWSQKAKDMAPAVGNLTGMHCQETRWKAPPYGYEPWELGTA